MLRIGLVFLTLCLCPVALGAILNASHLVVSGPCAGPGAIAIYTGLIATGGLGILCTLLGSIFSIVRRIRTHLREP
jgi:hypothetical protein